MVFLLTAGAALLLLSSVWHGWSAGLPRILVEVAGFIGAGLAAWTLHPVLASWIQPVLSIPRPVAAVLGGAVIWIGVVAICKIVSLIFIKKTKHYANPLKLIFGLSGAVLGLIEGLFIIFAFAIGFRVAGTMAEGLKPPPSDSKARSSFITSVAEAHKAIEQSWPGGIVAALDPIPRRFHANLKKACTILRDRDAMERFLSFSQTRDLLAHPRLEPIMADPQVTEALRQRRFDQLVKKPNVVAAVNDPDVWAKLQAFPWSEAMDYAVPDETSPADRSGD